MQVLERMRWLDTELKDREFIGIDRYNIADITAQVALLTARAALRHSGVVLYDLTFPSPLPSDIPENNTVHAEYFVPAGATDASRCPAVVCLDIMQGNQLIARAEAMWLAQNGVAALVVVLPHYNQRRASGSKVKLVSTDIPRTLGQPDQGFEGNRFTGIPMYDALTHWDLSKKDEASVLIPGLALAVTVLSLNLLGDGLRDVLDPRLRGR